MVRIFRKSQDAIRARTTRPEQTDYGIIDITGRMLYYFKAGKLETVFPGWSQYVNTDVLYTSMKGICIHETIQPTTV